MAIGSTLSVGLIGLKAFIVQVQAFISWLAILPARIPIAARTAILLPFHICTGFIFFFSN